MNHYSSLLKVFGLSIFVLCGGQGFAQQEDEADLFDMSLEDLMNVEVTSVSKKAERLQDVASSIYVLTSEDIRKTGATTLHEVLRTVPGYWGAQDEYSSVNPGIRVSRTFGDDNGTVLYLLDGTPLQGQMNSSFSFRNFDIPLSHIERIEVIRGSGGTIYGANSATGVVNIFTKSPEDYSGIYANVEGALPGYGAASLSAGGSLSDKVSVSGYAKARYFSGFESMAGVDEEGNPTVESSRFTKNYDESTMLSGGLGLNYAISARTKLSLRSHFNMLNKYDYANYVRGEDLDLLTQTITGDVLVENETNANRVVSNLRLDHTFSDQHSLFVRVSTNRENDYIKLGGGFDVSNAIYDFEVQDNLSVGSANELSFGGNVRMINYDIHDIQHKEGINYLDPQNTEMLKGAFLQDRINLLDDKVNVILGIKAENFSLINDKFYLSPMAKVSYLPNENVTLWGGYTRSFTTPGYNLTNIDLFLFETPSLGTWTNIATQAIYGQTYQAAFQAAAENGDPNPEATAANAATNYVASEEGQVVISATAAGLLANTPSVALTNSNTTTPTQFRTWELGVRTSLAQKWTVESNLFYTKVLDGTGSSLENVYQESPTQPGRFASYILYGNYRQGTSLGAESMVRFRPTDGLSFELSHTYLTSSWEYQENDDFDISDPTTGREAVVGSGDPVMPEHTIKFRSSLDVGQGLNVNVGIIYASKFDTQSEYKFEDERYPVITIAEPTTQVAENSARTIVNLRVEKKLLSNSMALYVFGNDIFNRGMIAQTNYVYNTTLSRIGAMYGLGVHYKLTRK